MLSHIRCLSPLPHHVRLVSSTVPAPRRGRNLTDRYCALERTTRAKCQPHTHVSQGAASLAKLQPNVPQTPTIVKAIAGFVVPEEPRAPADDECCMSGCAVCVYDLYDEALAAYRDSVGTLRASLSARHIPETEWPAHIRTDTGQHDHTTSPAPTDKSKEAVLGAFEAMERALQEKRVRRAAVEAEKRARGDGAGLDLREVYEGIKWILFSNR